MEDSLVFSIEVEIRSLVAFKQQDDRIVKEEVNV